MNNTGGIGGISGSLHSSGVFPTAAEAVVLVIFGASGDLAHRKVIPAVYSLFRRGCWSGRSVIIGYARSEGSDESLRDSLTAAIAGYAGADLDEDSWSDFVSRIFYQRGDYGSVADFRKLQDRCDSLAAGYDIARRRMFYLATPPGQFPGIITALGECGLAMTGNYDGSTWSRIVIEKPFGRDLDSARQLNALLARSFDERQIYRIDHYLGKETVQNLLSLRFANGIFEPLWRREHISNVQITVAETLGVGNRGGYYDGCGAVRDMLQNHMMNLMALVAMEPPSGLDGESIRDEKVKVLQAVRPLSVKRCQQDLVRARYTRHTRHTRSTAATIGDEQVLGYLDEKDVAADSRTETFAAARLMIDNWRWSGVPFYLRTGKRLARRVTEISIEFTSPPPVLFNSGSVPGNGNSNGNGNVLVIRVQPEEALAIRFQVKQPFSQSGVMPFWLRFPYSDAIGSGSLPDAYERLILDAAGGDPTLFIRSDEIETAWQIVGPMITPCAECEGKCVRSYPAGSWGPVEADQLLEHDGLSWREPMLDVSAHRHV